MSFRRRLNLLLQSRDTPVQTRKHLYGKNMWVQWLKSTTKQSSYEQRFATMMDWLWGHETDLQWNNFR